MSLAWDTRSLLSAPMAASVRDHAAVAAARAHQRALILILLLAFVAYANALSAGFTLDDEPDIQTNAAVKKGLDLIGIFASPLPPGDLYRPLTVLTFAVNETLAPGNTVAYHAVNVALHIAVTVLVFCLALRLFESAPLALIAALLFAVHPVHTEAVTSLVGRAELLAALFGLAAMLSIVAADRTARGAAIRGGLRALSLLLFCLALLSKESAVTFLPLIVLFRITCRRERLLPGLARECWSMDWVAYALCIGVYLLLRGRVLGTLMVTSVLPLDNVLAFVSASVRVRSALGILWDYFALVNVPLVLSADYSYAQVPIIDTWTDPRFLAGLALVFAAGAAVVRHRCSALAFTVMLPFLALSLTSNVLFPIGTVKAERLLYLPSAGWALLVGYALHQLLQVPRYRRLGIVLIVTVTAVFTTRTWARNRDWMSNATLYRSTIHTAPRSAKAHYNMGIQWREEGNDSAAIAEFRRSLELFPGYGSVNPALSIGIVFDRRNQTETAIEWYRKAVEIDPDSQKAHTNLCRALLIQARFSEAATACRHGLRYAPSDANLLKAVGESLIGVGETDKGLDVLRRALARDPADRLLRARIGQVEGASPNARPSPRTEDPPAGSAG